MGCSTLAPTLPLPPQGHTFSVGRPDPQTSSRALQGLPVPLSSPVPGPSRPPACCRLTAPWPPTPGPLLLLFPLPRSPPHISPGWLLCLSTEILVWIPLPPWERQETACIQCVCSGPLGSSPHPVLAPWPSSPSPVPRSRHLVLTTAWSVHSLALTSQGWYLQHAYERARGPRRLGARPAGVGPRGFSGRHQWSQAQAVG